MSAWHAAFVTLAVWAVFCVMAIAVGLDRIEARLRRLEDTRGVGRS